MASSKSGNFFDWEHFVQFLHNQQEEPQKMENDPEPMHVIGVGFGRTSTASLKRALELLQLKTYHMKHAILEHRELWLEHAQARLKGEEGHYPKIVKLIASQGFNATVDEPNNFHFEELLEMYPDALVILTVRPYHRGGKDWSKSVVDTIQRFFDTMARTPWRWIPAVRRFCKPWFQWIRSEQFRPLREINPEMKNDIDMLALAYDTWSHHVRARVPADRLLVFAATDGWPPLCTFLKSLEKPRIDEACQLVVQNGLPYPRANDTKQLQTILGVLDVVSTLSEHFPFVLAILLCFGWLKRRRKRPVRIHMKES